MSTQTELNKTFPVTYSSFSGDDHIGVLNGHIIGEILEVRYEETFSSYPAIKGTIRSLLFNEPTIKSHMNKEEADEFTIFYKNELENKLSIQFKGFKLTKRHGTFSLKDEILEEIYHFTCEDLIYDTKSDFGILGEDKDFAFGYKEEIL